MTESTSARKKKPPAAYLVILVSTVPEPAPNKASVAVAPNARPAPASFFGSWISTKKTRITQSSTITNVNRAIKNPIITVLCSLPLDRILDYISKTPGFKRSSTHQRTIHVELAHQFTRIG